VNVEKDTTANRQNLVIFSSLSFYHHIRPATAITQYSGTCAWFVSLQFLSKASGRYRIFLFRQLSCKMAAEFGCSHYIRKCKLVVSDRPVALDSVTRLDFCVFQTPCCDKVYICRCCHDENEDHAVNRRAVTELICACCGLRQPVRATCLICQTRFGKVSGPGDLPAR
jgi:uncharacterized CHY-type Zn-finger protein